MPDGQVVFDLFWADQEEWNEANRTLARLFDIHGSGLEKVRRLARRAEDSLLPVFDLMDEFSAQVCPACAAVCCQAASCAFEFTDLLFLHALSLAWPPHQLRRSDQEPCRYLGPVGCLLERPRRPFICTWYYCAPMLELYRQQPPRLQRTMSARLKEAQRLRMEMEKEFISLVVAGPGGAST
ncbi:MAG: hypothetical protein AB1641_13300 [Thermodesulfobacteriota bacterium]